MKPIVEKVLSSGLIDRSMAELMEKYQMLPEGAADKVREATREQMLKVAEEVVDMAERDRVVKETRFDLEKLRWPVKVQIIAAKPGFDRTAILDAVIDRMGRYFFRYQDVKEEWFVPGYMLTRAALLKDPKASTEPLYSRETILESQTLFIDDTPVAIQVTTARV